MGKARPCERVERVSDRLLEGLRARRKQRDIPVDDAYGHL
jgi:hypothetical protein